MTPPRLLIEEWLPAAAIGVECMRERGTGNNPPNARLHVWWARRPLTVSRAAVLASLLPADFPRDIFERLLGFGKPGKELVEMRRIMDSGVQLGGFGCDRAFKRPLREDDLCKAHVAARGLWGNGITVLDPMAGGGSIPLESARLGLRTLANEYNPVACSVLEATVDYPFRFGEDLARRARKWADEWRHRFNARVLQFYPKRGSVPTGVHVFARTVPCPDSGFRTPLVPDWHLLKPKDSEYRLVAEPVVNKAKGTWTVRIVEVGKGAGKLSQPPRPTYARGKGISLFTNTQIPDDYIKAKAQAGEMKSAVYAIELPAIRRGHFVPPEQSDLDALVAAEAELARLRPEWEKNNIIPTEEYPVVSSDERPRIYGMPRWADMFSPRQLLCMGVLVEELRRLRPEIVKAEGPELGEAIVHLLAFGMDKFANWNAALSSWNAPFRTARSVFDRHDFAFKATFAEMAPCHAGAGLEWAVDNVLEAYEQLAQLAANGNTKGQTLQTKERNDAVPIVFRPVEISFGSATNLPWLADGSVTAVVVDPPYADNVQYSELADFFYVWLKRTQGHRRPEWFSTYLCEHDQEAVVNLNRHRDGGKKTAAQARAEAHRFYQQLMTETFKEAKRVLRDDGVLTVMFTHKKQEAWEALFSSLIRAGFTITATWPVKTESEHSLHQAKKNAAQSTVILVARERPKGAGIGYFDAAMKQEIRTKARQAAERLQADGLNPVDQLVGSFGPAMEVYSRYDEVRTDTGQVVGVDKAIDEASDAVSQWRIQQLAARGLEGVEPEGKFVLLCWDVLGASEFRFNEAKLLGHAVGMDVDQLVSAGLVTRSGDKIRMLSAKERRRDRALEPDEVNETLFGQVIVRKQRKKGDVLKVHPNDPSFRTALDGCHALALRYIEAGSGSGGIGSARGLARQQNWTRECAVARLMEALVKAAPLALRFEKGKKSAAAQFPEFRAWHALLEPLFGVTPPEWKEEKPLQTELALREHDGEMEETEQEDEEDSET